MPPWKKAPRSAKRAPRPWHPRPNPLALTLLRPKAVESKAKAAEAKVKSLEAKLKTAEKGLADEKKQAEEAAEAAAAGLKKEQAKNRKKLDQLQATANFEKQENATAAAALIEVDFNARAHALIKSAIH